MMNEKNNLLLNKNVALLKMKRNEKKVFFQRSGSALQVNLIYVLCIFFLQIIVIGAIQA